MLRLMLLAIVGFVLGLAGGWMNPTETFVARSSAAEVGTTRASANEPLSNPAATPNERADAPEALSESSGSRRAARRRRLLKTNLPVASGKPAKHQAATKTDDEDDDDE